MVPKLSAAITAALALNMPQIRGRFFGQTPEGDLCGCAVGQALIAVNIVTRETALKLVRDYPNAYPLNEHVGKVFVPMAWYAAEPGLVTPMSLAARYNDGWDPKNGSIQATPLSLAEIAAKLAAVGE